MTYTELSMKLHDYEDQGYSLTASQDSKWSKAEDLFEEGKETEAKKLVSEVLKELGL